MRHDARCPTCLSGWWLNHPVKISGADAYRCVECKAVYTGSMLAAEEMLEALVGIANAAEEFVADVGADLQEGRAFDDACKATLAKWSAVHAAIAKATGRSETMTAQADDANAPLS